MKLLLPLTVALLLTLRLTAQETAPATEQAAPPAADSHTEIADALVDFLRRTDASLAACTDEATARAAIPQLEALRAEAAELAARQAALPEPTVQDYMATQDRANEFLQLGLSIRAHLTRMEKDGILLPDIRKILHMAPEKGALPE